MEDKNVIEICVGVGMNQIFPETIKIVLDEEKTSEPIKKEEKDRDHEKYYYFSF